MAKGELYLPLFIDLDLWPKAGWSGCVYYFHPRHEMVPILGLQFKNYAVGRDIFLGLQQRVGAVDQYDELRVSIVEGDVPGRMPGYSVSLGPNIDGIGKRAAANGLSFDPEVVMIVTRNHRMNPPPTSTNLANFKESYRRHGMYRILPVDASAQPQPDMNLAIQKREIQFRTVDQIGQNDLDQVLLSPDSDD